MASSNENCNEGYDVSRFELPVRPELLCGICRDVPKDPRLCHKDHPSILFCSYFSTSSNNSIMSSLHSSSNSRNPEISRWIFKALYMKINCDYSERGCPDYVRLENLQSHVDQCGFAPMICTNEGCETKINRKDQDIHERNYCQFSIAKCHDCSDIKESQEQSKARLDEMKAKLNEAKVHIAEIETKQTQIYEKINPIKVIVNQMKQSQIESQNETKRKQDQINEKVNEITANVDEIKQTQTDMKADQVALKTEMRQQFEKITELMTNQILQGSNNRAQTIDQAIAVHSVINQDIIILGGYYALGLGKVSNTAEAFNIVGRNSLQIPPMNHPRASSASCVYNNDVIVAGGYDGKAGSDTIEILKMNQHPLQWRMFDGKLPAKLSGYSVIVYRGTLFVIGGFNLCEMKYSDAIYELRLIPSYTFKLLVRMPQSRGNHRTELINGKLYILGGTTTGYGNDVIDSVLVYDFLTNECKPCASLPRAVCRMSTVTWGNMIIVVGGKDKNDEDLNDVIMYDTETGRSKNLPSMIYKRSGCSAVIMDDVIVVFGGWNKEQEHLNSMERFTLGSDGWKELPLRMKEKRYCATAVLKPHN